MTVNHVAVGSSPTKRASLSINMSMKPVLIYTMPRTRSNAALDACKRSIKISEPFDIYNLPNYDPIINKSLVRTIETLVNYDQWTSLENRMNQPNTAIKIFGHSLLYYYPARRWFEQAKSTHQIYTLIRPLKEVILSELLAFHLGYTKDTQKAEKEIVIRGGNFYSITTNIESFLRFYPQCGQLTTFESLPKETFDKNQIQLQEQHSMNKIHLIKNIDEVTDNIHTILSYYKDQWEDVTGLDIHAPLAQR